MTEDERAATSSVMEGLRSQLLERRRELVRRVQIAEEGLEDLDQSTPAEVEEEAQENKMAVLLAQLDRRGRAEFAAIDEAILRMDRGDYGTCERCGEPIYVERLRALPTATMCISCAEEVEHDRRRRAEIAEPEVAEEI